MNAPAAPRALLADDEPHLARALAAQLAELWPELRILHLARHGLEAAQRIAELQPDIAFLDIQMPGLTGLQVAQGIEGETQVVFVTAYDDYAVPAFEHEAVDYLLKPVKAARLADALRKVGRSSPPAGAIVAAAEAIQPGGRRQLRSSERGKVLLVPVADILYFKAELKYVTARTREREFLLEESLAQLESEFATRFLRIHRNCLVARDAIAGFERDHEVPDEPESSEPRWALILRDVADRLPVSRRQWPQVKAMLS